MKFVKLKTLKKHLVALQEIEDILPAIKADADKFIRLSDLLCEDYITTEKLLVSQDDWAWLFEMLQSYWNQGMLWRYLDDTQIDRSAYARCYSEILSLPFGEGGMVYV